MKPFRAYGASAPEESRREREHRALARRAAAEGMVLLKNDGVLPLKPQRIALYGPGARMTVKGGSGSGNVHERSSVTIEQGLLNAGFTLTGTGWMDRVEAQYQAALDRWRAEVEEKAETYSPLRTMDMFIMIGQHPRPQPVCAAVEEADLSDDTDTAVYVVARQAGEGDDRRAEKGQYYLSDQETDSLRLLSSHYKKLILVLNCGGVVDLSVLNDVRVDAVLFYGQGGMEGGSALADLLTGAVTPSGRLADTWAYRYEDYPGAASFGYLSGDLSHSDYREGTYIGYRWFEANGIRPRYPFGYGLSYTTFASRAGEIAVTGTEVAVSVEVVNTGTAFSGKETAMLFLRRPDDGARRLVAFEKTGELAPGERETLRLRFDISQEGGFSQERSRFELVRGEYGLYLGDSAAAVLTLDEDVVTERVEHICPGDRGFTDFSPETGARYDAGLPRIPLDPGAFTAAVHSDETPEPRTDGRVKELLDRLSGGDLVRLVTGGGYDQFAYNRVQGACGNTCTKLVKKGIPNIVLADGPAGVNVNQTFSMRSSGIPCYPDGLPEDWQWGWLRRAQRLRLLRGPDRGVRTIYHYMTAFPCETLQAQSWNRPLLEEIGRAVGREMAEAGVTVWLAPGANLHRNPLCGRNFEYYAEDPVLSGHMAAAVARGVQSVPGCGVCVKHFCCNNQEDNREHMSSNLSEKALREIYLRSFRIAVQEGRPWTVMTSYNMLNGVYTPNSRDLCTRVLRCEWGFEGLVMSDWNATEQCSHAAAVNAGNDLIMPGNQGVRKALQKALKTGELDRNALRRSAARVLELVFKAATSKDFK